MANWTKELQPFGANHAPLLTGLSSVDGVTPVPVGVDPATGGLLTSGGGSGGTQYTDGATPPTHPIGNALEWSNGTTWQTASTAQPLPVTAYEPSVVSVSNSSTIPLTTSATFTGTGTSVMVYNYVMVLVNSDQPSAPNGVQIQFSEDNTNWIDSSPFTYTPGTGTNAGQSFAAIIRGPYARVVYTNTNHAQTSFALQTIFMGGSMSGDITSINQTLNANQHAQLVNAQIFGASTSGGGTYVPVKVNPSGTLAIGNTSVGTVGSAVPTDATQVGGTDGTNLQSIGAKNTTPAGTEYGLITRNIPSGTQTVSGTVAATQSGTWTTSRNWTLANSTDSVTAYQGGTWTPNQGTGGTSAWKVKDDYGAAEILAQQSGSGTVLSFTFANAMDFIWVTDVGSTTTNISYVDPFGGTPSASLGIPVFNATPTPISVTPANTVIKVYAPSGATIQMYGYRRT